MPVGARGIIPVTTKRMDGEVCEIERLSQDEVSVRPFMKCRFIGDNKDPNSAEYIQIEPRHQIVDGVVRFERVSRV